MALRINTNVAALNAHKNMISNDNMLSSSLAKLSSGLRINKAADDASGMSIADSLRAQSMGLGQAIKNANDGINIVQTADAALAESINIVNTIRTKAIQSAQDGQTTTSRAAIQADIDKLMEQLDIIAETTTFNNQKLLFGNFTNKKFQVGAYSGETVNISIASSQSTKMGHVTSGQLSIVNNAAGSVELSIYSNLQDKDFLLEAVDLQYNNSAENGINALANAINIKSSELGINASAIVTSRTGNGIAGGRTNEGFKINGVNIGAIENIQRGDANGALVAGINRTTAQHGVVASVDSGELTLTSQDGRAIYVETGGSDTEAVLNNADMSTFGFLQLNQLGASEIVVSSVGGGAAVALTNDLEVAADTAAFTADGLGTKGSMLTGGSILGAGWITDQDLNGSNFAGAITTTSATTLKQNSALAVNSVLGIGTEIAAGSTLAGDATVEDISNTTAQNTIVSGSSLAVGSSFSVTTAETIEDTITIESTNATTAAAAIVCGSTLAAGTVLEAGLSHPNEPQFPNLPNLVMFKSFGFRGLGWFPFTGKTHIQNHTTRWGRTPCTGLGEG